jgi:hypothetical protein
MNLIIKEHPAVGLWVKQSQEAIRTASEYTIREYHGFFLFLLGLIQQSKCILTSLRTQRNLFGFRLPQVILSAIGNWLEKDQLLYDLPYVNKYWNKIFLFSSSSLHDFPYSKISWKISDLVKLPVPSHYHLTGVLFVDSSSSNQMNILISYYGLSYLVFVSKNSYRVSLWKKDFSKGYLNLVKRNPVNTSSFNFHRPLGSRDGFKFEKWKWVVDDETAPVTESGVTRMKLIRDVQQIFYPDTRVSEIIAYSKQVLPKSNSDPLFINIYGNSYHLQEGILRPTFEKAKFQINKKYFYNYSISENMFNTENLVTLDDYNLYIANEERESEDSQIHVFSLKKTDVKYEIPLRKQAGYRLKLIRSYQIIVFVVYEWKNHQRIKKRLNAEKSYEDDIIYVYYPENQKRNPSFLDLRSLLQQQTRKTKIERILIQDIVVNENKICILIFQGLLILE